MMEEGSNLPTRTNGDECDDLLALLSPPGEAMDFDWLLEENATSNMRLGEEATVVSPTPSVESWRNWQQPQLRNVTAITRSLAVPNDNALHDQSHVSRSLATPPLASSPSSLPIGHKNAEPQLANMSAVSHNLANVGALPQCNQRHARCVAPVAVAEDTSPPHAVVVDMDHHQQQQILQQSSPRGGEQPPRTLLDLSSQQQQQFRFSAAVVPTATAVPKPRGRRLQRTAATDDQNKKLEMRRTKNREAAERMRRRRREETAGLEKTVRELTLRVDELSAKLAASEAENEQLRGLKQLVFAVATQPQPAENQHDPATTKLIADQQHTSRVMPQEQN